MYYCFSVSKHEDILCKFQKTHDAHNNGDHFCSREFEDKEECIKFAHDIERMKYERGETQYIIKLTTNPLWNFFVGYSA